MVLIRSLLNKHELLNQIRTDRQTTYLKGVFPGFFWRVISSICLPFLATKLASLSAAFFTAGSLGEGGAACHLKN